MNCVFINNKKYTAPGSFNELSKEQLLHIIALLHSRLNKISYQMKVLFTLVSFKKKDLKGVNAEHLYDMLALTDFTLTKINLTKNLLPEIKVNGITLHGPSDRLSNIIFIEFIKAEKYYIDYAKTNNEASLNKLVAILYRPQRIDISATDPKFDGDIRERYNDHFIESRSAVGSPLAGVPINIKRAIFFFYQSCRESIVAIFPEIFQEPEEGSKPEKGSQGWTDVLINLAGNKFGDMEATAHTRLYTILATLKNNYYQQLKMEELYGK
jgi:hypothetical protein